MNALILTCLLCAAPVPKQWKPPVVIDSWACGWKASRGEDFWFFALHYTEAMIRDYIEAEDRKAADPLYRKREE